VDFFLICVCWCNKFDEIEGEYVRKEFIVSSLNKQIKEYISKYWGVLVRMGYTELVEHWKYTSAVRRSATLNGSTRRAALLHVSVALNWRKPEAILLMPFKTPPLCLQIELLGVELYLRENCSSASQEISHLLWNPKDNRGVHTLRHCCLLWVTCTQSMLSSPVFLISA
jgi:hypothetical protein